MLDRICWSTRRAASRIWRLSPARPKSRPITRNIANLCGRLRVSAPAIEETHFTTDLGPVLVKWARHTEFVSFAILLDGRFADPFEASALVAAVEHELSEIVPQLAAGSKAVLVTATTPPTVKRGCPRASPAPATCSEPVSMWR